MSSKPCYVLNEKKLAENVMSFVRKIKTKVGFASRTQLTINKQLKGVLKILFENSLKYVWQCREQKYSVWNIFLRKLASKDLFTPANSVKHMMSNFGHSQKWLLKKIKRSSSNAEKISFWKFWSCTKTHGKGCFHS